MNQIHINKQSQQIINFSIILPFRNDILCESFCIQNPKYYQDEVIINVCGSLALLGSRQLNRERLNILLLKLIEKSEAHLPLGHKETSYLPSSTHPNTHHSCNIKLQIYVNESLYKKIQGLKFRICFTPLYLQQTTLFTPFQLI